MSRIGRLTATIAVPDHGDLPLGALDRIGTAVTERVPAALARRFPDAREHRPDADTADRPVVLIRRLQVSVPVPATASAEDIAERLADRLARAIRTAPDEGRVRYPSRAAHIAAFIAALAAGTGDTWVFASFDGVRLLAPLTALRTLVERYGLAVVAVLAALHDTGDLPAVLRRATAAELARTWAACLAVPRVLVSRAEAAEHLGDGPVDDARLPAARSAELLALILAARVFARDRPAGVAVAVASVLATTGAVHDASPVRRAKDAERRSGTSGSAAAASPAAGPTVFAADGAPAFLLLPSFAKVGLGELAPAQRARVLAVATRTAPDDPAVVLASGLEGDEQEPGPDIAYVVQQALIDDDRLGAERLVTLHRGPHMIVADATSGIWLAIVDAAEPVDGALIPPLAGLPISPLVPDDAMTARMVADLRFLMPADTDTDASGRAVAVAARAGLGHFARRLPGFGASSLPYLSDRFLTPGGVIADLGDSIWVRLPSPPLLVVLALAGLDRTTVEVPWLQPVVTITHEDTG